MDRKNSPLTKTESNKPFLEANPSKVKRLINDFTEIKRPPGKSKLLTENSGLSRGSRTLPRTSKDYKHEVDAKITKQKITSNSVNAEFQQHSLPRKGKPKQIESNSSWQDSDPLVVIGKKVEEFAEKLKERRTKAEMNEDASEDKTNKKEVSKKKVSFRDPERNEVYSESVYEDEVEVDDVFEAPVEEIHNFLDDAEEMSDEMFGFNAFDEDCEDNFIIETYNDPGRELIFITLEITRRSVKLDDEKEDIDDLIQNSDIVLYENSELNNNDDFGKSFEFSGLEADGYQSTVSNNDNYGKSFDFSRLEPAGYRQHQEDHSTDPVYEDLKVNLRRPLRYFKNYVDRNGEADAHYYRNIDFSSDSDIYDEVPTEDQHDLSQLPTLEVKPNTLERKERVNYVIEELIKTEELYINSLETVVHDYIPYLYKNTPQDLLGKSPYLFGNINRIYEEAQRFLVTLELNSESADKIAQAFIDSAGIFELYPQYSRNKPTADKYLKKFDEVVKERQKQLCDKLGLSSYLLTPIQRLTKYIVMLESIQKELKKSDLPLDSINSAITVIRKVTRKCNDFIAVDSIKNCIIDLTMQGSFIMRANFNILKPKKFTSMIFLFESVIVFTQQASKVMEQFDYVDSIQMSDLSLGKFEEKPYIFHLTDYPKLKKANREAFTYILEAESPKTKSEWTTAIEAKLWSQLQNAKEKQSKLSAEEGKRLSRISIASGSNILRKSSKYHNKTRTKSRSTFYDHRNTSDY